MLQAALTERPSKRKERWRVAFGGVPPPVLISCGRSVMGERVVELPADSLLGERVRPIKDRRLGRVLLRRVCEEPADSVFVANGGDGGDICTLLATRPCALAGGLSALELLDRLRLHLADWLADACLLRGGGSGGCSSDVEQRRASSDDGRSSKDRELLGVEPCNAVWVWPCSNHTEECIWRVCLCAL